FIVLGGGILLFQNVRRMLVGGRSEAHLSVYFQEGKAESNQAEIQRRFCSESFVKNCRYRSKQEAQKQFVHQNPEMSQAVASLPENPFPASVEMEIDPEFKDATRLKSLSKELSAFPGVEAVDDGGEWLTRWVQLLSLADNLMILLAVALSLAMII